MSNIKEVAKVAGVSTSTVSRVINNNSSISKKTKDKVWKAIEELNYSPNEIAKALINSKSYTITLLIDLDDTKSFQNPFFYEIMHGIENYCSSKGFSLMVANINTNLKRNNIIEWLVKSKRTEGIILPTSILTPNLVKKLKLLDVPFVAIGEINYFEENISWVDIDNHRGTKKAVYELLNMGYSKIAFIGKDDTKDFSKRRVEGYIKALEEKNIKVDHNLIIECGNNKIDGYKKTKKMFDQGLMFDAIICGTDNLSIGVIKAINEQNLNVPEDIGIISYDSRRIATLIEPEVTTVDVDLFEMGFQASKMLFNKIDDKHCKNQGLLVGTEIIKRNTTK